MKTLVIAEKPSVAADIAKALGKLPKKGDFFENDNYIISSAIGHVVTLFMPDDIDKKLRYWTLEALPILPKEFQLKPIEKTEDRFRLLEKLIKRKDVDQIINACDAGREGELIFRYILQLTGTEKPMKRLWLSSMTPTAIRDGFQHLRNGHELDNLANAAMCRSESDWLIGINGTRAFTRRLYGSKVRQLATVGRVQTPTLAILCEREQRIKDFKSKPYWEVEAHFEIQNGQYIGRWIDETFQKSDREEDADLHADRIWDETRAQAIQSQCEGKPGVISEEKKPSTQAPPLLYDLTSLQREANGRFGFSATRTLQIAQSLYEKRKMITYPRTDSRCLPEDYLTTVKNTLQSIAGTDSNLSTHAAKVLEQSWAKPNKRIFNNAKVSDHFAIIPTGQFASGLDENEAKLFDLIAKRFVAIFFPSAQFEITTRLTRVEKEVFKTEGRILKDAGWLIVYGKEEQQEDVRVPAVVAQEMAQTLEVNVLSLVTRPPARFTEATLLTAMETAGKLLEDEELREAMKERGLGTPATRAAIIESLLAEAYIRREGRELIATAKGMALVELLRGIHMEALTSPAMTGEWEHKLRLMEHGQLSREKFMSEIVDITKDIVHKAKTFDENQLGAKPLAAKSPVDGAAMVETYKNYQSVNGNFTIWKVISGRKIEPQEAITLIENRMIGPLDNFVSAKTKKTFSATLRLSPENKVEMVFDRTPIGADGQKLDLSTMTPIGKCPVCGSGIFETHLAYLCEKSVEEKPECTFKIGKKILSRDIELEQAKKLLEAGKTDLLDKFWSQRTRRPFSAYLKLDEKGKVGFEFAPRPPKSPKNAGRSKTSKKKDEDPPSE
ncbi:MAG: DNA topoisomerase III [Verrucomicrobiia bacterium]